MKIGIGVCVLAAGLNIGAAHADAAKPGAGFDRVGRIASEAQAAPNANRVNAAPGEGGGDAVAYAARKREMARRLVWLLLSAR